ncbi:MAG TPA: AsmA family protein [Candidatus Methylomirabilis sp.]|nr:AsmA family protein [Candidatus Methylomirabilis sp.]
MKALRWFAVVVGVLVTLVVAVVAYLAATFDPEASKPTIVDLVKRRTGRTLVIDGKIGFTLFPRIGASLGKVTLSEPDGAAIFARVDEVHVAVALVPLLLRREDVDRVTLKGLTVDLVRYEDGRTNFDDLIGQEATPPSSPSSPQASSSRTEWLRPRTSG